MIGWVVGKVDKSEKGYRERRRKRENNNSAKVGK